MINKEKFLQLKNFQSPICVSIYIPTIISGDYDKNRIRWKNACQVAQRKLEDQGVSPRDIDAILKPAFEIADVPEFWAHQSKGLCGFYAKDFDAYYHTSESFDETIMIEDSFYVHPLLKGLLNDQRIFILALSQNEVRFFEAVHDGIYPVIIGDLVPANMDKALMLDEQDKALQWHDTSSNNQAQFHGQGAGKDMTNVRLEQYFRKVDEGLMSMLHDERVPLVLASVEEYLPIYQSVSQYDYISNFQITGNPETMSPTDLHVAVTPLFDQYSGRRVQSFMNEYNIKTQENLSIHDIQEISDSAKYKNLDKLFVSSSIYEHSDHDQRKLLDDTIMNAYENGTEIIMTTHPVDDETAIYGIKRFEMEVSAS